MEVCYTEAMTAETTTVIILGAVLAVLNFLSVFGAMATLRWIDHRQKKAIADIFMRELGEKLETEASFQNIVRNMNVMPKNDEDDNDNGQDKNE